MTITIAQHPSGWWVYGFDAPLGPYPTMWEALGAAMMWAPR